MFSKSADGFHVCYTDLICQHFCQVYNNFTNKWFTNIALLHCLWIKIKCLCELHEQQLHKVLFDTFLFLSIFKYLILCRKYCVNCLNIWTDYSDKLVNNKSNDWICFLCLPEPNLLLQANHDWAQKVKKNQYIRNIWIYIHGSGFQVLFFHEPLSVYGPRALYWKKQPLRVLSLFDGIGTGKGRCHLFFWFIGLGAYFGILNKVWWHYANWVFK